MNPGQHLTPNLKLVRKIGQGAMGEVWLAEHLSLGSHVAVKVMGPEYANDDRSLVRFRQEAQAAARIGSPHVTRVFDTGTADQGKPFLVMELLEGETLRERMKRSGPMPIADVEQIVGQTAKGLSAAHKLGIFHRDIKPDNLFILDVDGEPFIKIMDFGIAKQSTAKMDVSSTGISLGTPSYMSPQQFHESKRVDQRADLWSLGVVAYEALTGRKPFHGINFVILSIAVTKGVFKMPSVHRPELPKAVDEWMQRALAPELEDRFSSAKEMADAFSLALQRSPEVKDKSIAPQSSSETESPAATSLAAQSLKSAAVRNKPSRARKEAARESDIPPSSAFAARDDLAVSVNENPIRGYFSLTGTPAWIRDIDFSASGDLLFASFGGGEVLCFDIATRKPRFWQRVFSRTYCLTASPSILAVGCGDGTVRLIDVARGAIEKTIQCHEGPVRGLALRRTALVTAGDDKRLALWNINSGERLQSGEQQDERFYSVAFGTPAGVIATGGRHGSLRIWDSALQLLRSLDYLAKGTMRELRFSPDGWLLAAACADGRVRIWETRGWTLSITTDTDRKPVTSVVFDAQGQVLAAGSSDGTIRFWHVPSGKLQQVLPGQDKGVVRLAMASDKRHFAAAYADGRISVHRWPIDPRAADKP